MKAASGLAQGRHAEPALAAAAVGIALARAGLSHAGAVLLYLSADFAHNAQAAVTAAARAGSCLQVAGCCAAGVFSDEDWVLDAPAAAALVLGDGAGLRAATEGEQRLTFAAPNALDLHWLGGGGPRYGGVSGDASGQGPYTVWCGARSQDAGRCELALTGVDLALGVSRGIQPLSRPARIGQMVGNDVHLVGGEAALSSLARQLPLSQRGAEHIPTHLLMAGVTYGAPEGAVAEGRYLLHPVVSVNARDRSVTVAGDLAPGHELFWAQLQPRAAELDMHALLERLAESRRDRPRFGLFFSCLGRGPFFYGGADRDLQALKQRFPGMPFVGFYGNGEIAHLDGANRLLQYSGVVGLGYDPVAPAPTIELNNAGEDAGTTPAGTP